MKLVKLIIYIIVYHYSSCQLILWQHFGNTLIFIHLVHKNHEPPERKVECQFIEKKKCIVVVNNDNPKKFEKNNYDNMFLSWNWLSRRYGLFPQNFSRRYGLFPQNLSSFKLYHSKLKRKVFFIYTIDKLSTK